MADDERALKAARAKQLLAKKRQQKAAATSASGEAATPSRPGTPANGTAPLERTLSPSAQQTVPETTSVKDIGDV
jgi:hypothetical protein